MAEHNSESMPIFEYHIHSMGVGTGTEGGREAGERAGYAEGARCRAAVEVNSPEESNQEREGANSNSWRARDSEAQKQRRMAGGKGARLEGELRNDERIKTHTHTRTHARVPCTLFSFFFFPPSPFLFPSFPFS